MGPVVRFIPACAGNSSKAAAGTSNIAVHPRVCGEQDYAGLQLFHNSGSSPRVRGTAVLNCCTATDSRFIPACAGNSFLLAALPMFLPVHPRVCGEQAIFASLSNRAIGSSPRVRGTEDHASRSSRPARFIPACAGNRDPLVTQVLDLAVHPRVCGEQAGDYSAQVWAIGSSPRVRGTGSTKTDNATQIRFIPACAGNSCFVLFADRTPAVHPRVCGEQFSGRSRRLR